MKLYEFDFFHAHNYYTELLWVKPPKLGFVKILPPPAAPPPKKAYIMLSTLEQRSQENILIKYWLVVYGLIHQKTAKIDLQKKAPHPPKKKHPKFNELPWDHAGKFIDYILLFSSKDQTYLYRPNIYLYIHIFL